MAPVEFQTIWDARSWIKKYSGIEGFDWYGNTNFLAQYVVKEFGQDNEYDLSLINVGKFDIETESNDGFPQINNPTAAITSIAYTDINKKYHVWGLKDYDVNKSILTFPAKKDIIYYKCESETDLLMSFINYWSTNYPDVITGWYIRLFDIPYMIRRINRVLGEAWSAKLSPFKVIEQKDLTIMNKQVVTFNILGVEQLDYQDLFRKFGYVYGTQENYKLDTIANTVLNEGKISYDEYGKLQKLYDDNHQLFIDYNIKDTALIERLDDVLQYIKLAMTIAYKAGSNFSDAFGTVAIWDNITYKYLHSQNIVVYAKEVSERPPVEGAYVKPPIPGKYRWVVSFDLDSLYPNLIIQYNMSPETILTKMEDHYTVEKLLNREIENVSNNAIAANGAHFSKSVEGFIPKLVKQLYAERVKYKTEMIELKKKQDPSLKTKIDQLDGQQQAIKILMNSLYGAMGNAGFRYFDHRIAEAITKSGQLAIKWAEKAINEYLQKILGTDHDYVIAMDTDSLYITLDELIQKVVPQGTATSKIVDMIDKLCKEKIAPVINKAYLDLHNYMKTYDNRMKMKRENIADVGIWTGKKHYILNVYDSEGVRYPEPKLKIMGLEAVKSSTPAIARSALKEAFMIALHKTEDDMHSYIKDFRAKFDKANLTDIAFPRGVNDLEKYANKQTIYGPKTPIHVRGSLLYNHRIIDQKLDKKLEKIQSGDKIRFIYLRVPNPIREDVISFPDHLPDELGLNQYIDLDLQFEKTFLKPLRSVLDAIGWKDKKQASIMNFFE